MLKGGERLRPGWRRKWGISQKWHNSLIGRLESEMWGSLKELEEHVWLKSQAAFILFVLEIWISSQNIYKRGQPSHVGSLGLVLGQRSKKQNFRVEFSRNENISVFRWTHWMTKSCFCSWTFEFLMLGKCLLPEMYPSWPEIFISLCF